MLPEVALCQEEYRVRFGLSIAGHGHAAPHSPHGNITLPMHGKWEMGKGRSALSKGVRRKLERNKRGATESARTNAIISLHMP